MIAFHFPLISGLADGCRKTNVQFGLTVKLNLLTAELKSIYVYALQYMLIVCSNFYNTLFMFLQ